MEKKVLATASTKQIAEHSNYYSVLNYFHTHKNLSFLMGMGFLIGFSAAIIGGSALFSISLLLGIGLLLTLPLWGFLSLYMLSASTSHSLSFARQNLEKLEQKQVRKFDNKNGFQPRVGSLNNPFSMRVEYC